MSKQTRLFYFVLYVLVMVFTDESSYSVPPQKSRKDMVFVQSDGTQSEEKRIFHLLTPCFFWEL
jgi:hypothetical protein